MNFTRIAPALAENPDCNPRCKACHYKHIDYPSQLARKQSWALEQLGSWQEVLHPILPAPLEDRLAYRSKSWMWSFPVDAESGEISFGMRLSRYVDGEWNQEYISWDRCPIHIPAINRITARLRSALQLHSPEFTRQSLVGVWIGSPHLVIVSRDERSNSCPSSYMEDLTGLDWSAILEAPFDRTWFHCNPQVGRKVFGHSAITPLFGGSESPVHPVRAFRQVAKSLLSEARKRASRFLLQSHPEMILDLFSGTGELSELFPSDIGWLGIEMSREAVKYSETLHPPGRRIHRAFVGGVEQRLRDPQVLGLIEGRYGLYVNPPRPGLSADAWTALESVFATRAPDSIAYLSCSASSLARDLKDFERAGYRIDELQPFDFFPQTEHFETLALLRRPTHFLQARLDGCH